jgi:glutathione S-transferase
MRLHGFALSPSSRRAELGLAEHGVAYEWVHVDLTAGAHLRPEFRALNPNAKVPVLEDGDLILTESNAILMWLVDCHPEAGLGGQTPAERAHVARWMFFNTAHMGPAGAQIFAHTMLLPPARRLSQVAETARAELARCTAIVDGALAGRRWLLGDRYTIADISLAPNLYLAKTLLGADLSARPELARWLEQITARAAWKKVYGG